MYRSQDARELSILMRISRELDIVGDVTAAVDNPSELLAWASILTQPTIVAWRSEDSGQRYLQVTAERRREPVRGRITAVLHCDEHREFWNELLPDDLKPGGERPHQLTELSAAWEAMPISPPA
jgi:hypothetical protein